MNTHLFLPALLALATPTAAQGSGADLVIQGQQADAHLGAALAHAGDVNGDGFSDVIAGAPEFSAGQAGEGIALLYLGSATGLVAAPAWSVQGGEVDAQLGFAVSGAGDVNGDGYDDVLVGAPGRGSGQVGKAFLFHGGPTGLAAAPAWTGTGPLSGSIGEDYGAAVSALGDVDRDGRADVLVADPRADPWNGFQNAWDGGCVGVYRAQGSGFAMPLVLDGSFDDEFGFALGACDVDGDGQLDALVGGPRAQTAGGIGTLSVSFHLSGSVARMGEQSGMHFGSSVRSAGDVDGDGFPEVLVGAPDHDGSAGNTQGLVQLFRGSATGLWSLQTWEAGGAQAEERFGTALAGVGDVNGDGFGDVVVGAPGFDGPVTNGGRVVLFHGAADGLATTPAWTDEAYVSGGDFGCVVSAAGDVNGDGAADFVVGAPTISLGASGGGAVFVFHGVAPWGAVLRGIQQLQPGSEQAIPLHGRSLTSSSFRIRTTFVPRKSKARAIGSPAPRAWLEYEVQSSGTAFDGVEVLQGPPCVLGIGPLVVEALVTGLEPETAYAWRARVVTNQDGQGTGWFSLAGNSPGESKLGTAP